MELHKYNINYMLAHGAEGRGCTHECCCLWQQERCGWPPVVIRRGHQNPLEMELLAAESYPCSCWELTLGPRGEHCVLLPTKSSVC